MTVEEYRRFYAEEIRFVARLNTSALVEAFARVPRENFLGPRPWYVGSPERRALAAMGLASAEYIKVEDPRDLYHNLVVVIDRARNINNGQPSALAAWMDALELKPDHRVFHLGAGTGYYTAILAEAVGERGKVTACEVDPELAAGAAKNLAGYSNVTVHSGDGAAFDPGECDAILVNAGVTHVSALWLDRLHEGGRLVVPITFAIGPELGTGAMMCFTRTHDHFAAQIVSPVAIFSSTSQRDPQLEPSIRTAMSTQTLFRIRSLRRDTHEVAESCVVHGPETCLSLLDPPA